MTNHKGRSRWDRSTPGPDGPTIKALRESLGLTQQQAAALREWSAKYWQALENGERQTTRLDWTLWLHLAGVQRLPFKKRNLPDV